MKYQYLLLSFLLMQSLFGFSQQPGNLYFEKVVAGPDTPHTAIMGIVKDKDGFVWFGSWDGLFRFDGIQFKIFRNTESDENGISSNRIRTIFPDDAGELIVMGFDRELRRYDPLQESFQKIEKAATANYSNLYEKALESIAKGKQVTYANMQWELDDGVLWQYNLQTGLKKQVVNDLSKPGALSDDFASWIFLDDQQILWVGMANGDINKADLNRKPFNFQYTRFEEQGIWKNNAIRAIYEDDKYLWLAGNYRNVRKLDKQTGRSVDMADVVPGGDNLLRTRAIVPDGKGNIWFGSVRGMHRYSPQRNQLKSYSPRKLFNADMPNSVFTFCCDDKGQLWAGLYGSIARYIPEKDQFEWFDLSSHIGERSVMAMLFDRQANLWLATEGSGLICLKQGAGKRLGEEIISYRNKHDSVRGLPGNRVYCLYEDDEGLIWAGTSNGLCYLDPEGEVHVMPENSGLSDGYISAVTGDANGNIWISHKAGLARYNKKSDELRHFDPLVDKERISFLDNSCYKNPETGQIYFGAQSGWLSFQPSGIKLNPIAPVVRFTALEVLNSEVAIGEEWRGRVLLEQALAHTNELTFSFWERSFALSFAALSYAEPANNRYRYKLEGFDKNWIETGAANAKAVYSNLPAGRYVLKVKAANPDGAWSDEQARILIRIKPPFWASSFAWAFYVSIIVAVLIAIYYYLLAKEKFRSQLALERVEKEKIRAVDNVKLEFYTNVSHELRTPLSLILDPVEKLSEGNVPPDKQRDYLQIIHRNATRLLSLINQLLDFRKIETQNETLNPTYTDWVEFARQITGSFQMRARRRQIELSFHASEPSVWGRIDQDKFEKILFNLLGNAIKYTPDEGTVQVDVQERKAADQSVGSRKTLVLSVNDSGIGIPDDAQQTIFSPFVRIAANKSYEGSSSGIGLALTKKLVELMGGTIRVESKPGHGSRFIVELPLEDEQQAGEQVVPVAEEVPLNQQAGQEYTSEKPLLLIVDDNPEIRNYLEKELQDLFKIETAENGKEAKQKATNLVPDIIISDLMMPEMDGIEFCKKIKSDIRTSHIPVILLTARQAHEFKIEGLEKGADAYMTKPFNSSVLKAQVKSLVENRRKVQQQFQQAGEPLLDAKPELDLEQEFLRKAIGLVQENLNVEGFNSDVLAEKLNLSQRQLYRKLDALTGQTVHQFITSIRMNRAKELLLKKEMSISDVAFEVGYNELSTFSRSFSKQFGKSPSQFLAEN
ncbi:signal transduction histidine kinase [Mangrovibacterium marinum]|uniref:histidine kinase n=1 Tax=Mangrovibacterium marinum TaxID=1639118 RepID=A0A2T5BXP7_9BACT|nr:ATP-binding protein [Mangrovibacterium marinum]PTN05922.1 signal transduction histidine kinase [Mangrovibacterium marinum]